MKFNILLHIIFLFYSSYIFGQRVYCHENLSLYQEIENTSLYTYQDLELKKVEKNKVKYDSPEDLLNAYMSASDIESYQLLFNEVVEKTNQNFKEIRDADKDDYIMKPLLKFSFMTNGLPYVIVKYHLFYKNEMVSNYVVVCKKVKDRWYIERGFSLSLAMFFGTFKTEYLESILKGQSSDNEFLNSLVTKYNGENGIDLDGIINEIENFIINEDPRIELIKEERR